MKKGVVALAGCALGLFVVPLLAGCASKALVLMQGPKTGSIFQCGVWTDPPLNAHSANEDCARKLEGVGLKRL
jgi:hypothetical protein